MAQGDKRAYTAKQMRKARDIEQAYEEHGVEEKESGRRARATVNKRDGGGPGSGTRAHDAAAKSAGSRAGAATQTRRPAGNSARTKAAASAQRT